MRRDRLLCALTALICAGWSGPAFADNADAESCAVYRSFFEQRGGGEHAAFLAHSSPQLLQYSDAVQQETSPSRFTPVDPMQAPAPTGEPYPPPFHADTSSYFKQVRTKAGARISNCFAGAGPFPVEEWSSTFSQQLELRETPYWAVWTFSPVAFSENGKRALTAASMHCGSLCGGGYYLLFEKVGDRWTYLGHQTLWII